MDEERFRALMTAMAVEVDMMRAHLAAEEELDFLSLFDHHWGPDSERYADLLEAVAAYRNFPSTRWWAEWL